MKLSTFISETLKEIIGGVKDAQKYAKENDAVINPDDKNGGIRFKPTQDVNFEVAVTTESASGAEGGIAVFTGVFGVGTKGKTVNTEGTVSKIKFTVPIQFP